MKNLAGVQDADKYIKEELLLAGIPIVEAEPHKKEVPYSFIGTLRGWIFERAWYYWMANAPEGKGLPLEVAAQLHERKYPIIDGNYTTYGQTIRVAGHCGCPHPEGWASHFDEFGKMLSHDPKGYMEKEYKRLFSKGLLTKKEAEAYHFVRTVKELKKLTAKSLIDNYHIDDQLGLNEFARVIKHPNLERRL